MRDDRPLTSIVGGLPLSYNHGADPMPDTPVLETTRLDALLPPEMAARAEAVGAKKASMDSVSVLALAVLGGAFIGLGAIFSTTVAAGAAVLPYGLARLVIGIAFSLGLILVIVGGAELFTGNNLIVMAWASRSVTTGQLLRNWVLVYAGNLAGALSVAVLMYYSRQYEFGKGAVGSAALSIANAKVNLDFLQAVTLGVLCNVLVCLAVWLCFSARSTTDRIFAIVPPITAFVAAGFEHSIANMYFIPMGILIRNGGSEAFWTNSHDTASAYTSLSWENFFFRNLIPVTIGNIIGGAALVGLTYWFIYLRRKHLTR